MRQEFVIFLVFIVFLSSCASTPGRYVRWGSFENNFVEKPKDISNICAIFNQHPDWEQAAYASSKKWHIPVSVMMAMIYQESSFIGNARPIGPDGKQLSSAYGYSQALDDTWAHYQKVNNYSGKKRDNFADATDFIGWYNDVSKSKNGVQNNRPDLLYLNYHEGWGGFKNKTYMNKPELISISKKVYNLSVAYNEQLANCPFGSGKVGITNSIPEESGKYKKWF